MNMSSTSQMGTPTPVKSPNPPGAEVGEGEIGRKTAYAVIVPKTMRLADLDVYMFDTREEVKAFLSGTIAGLRPDIEGVRPELTDIAFLIASAKHAKITRNFYGETVLVLEYDESKYLSFFKNI